MHPERTRWAGSKRRKDRKEDGATSARKRSHIKWKNLHVCIDIPRGASYSLTADHLGDKREDSWFNFGKQKRSLAQVFLILGHVLEKGRV